MPFDLTYDICHVLEEVYGKLSEICKGKTTCEFLSNIMIMKV